MKPLDLARPNETRGTGRVDCQDSGPDESSLLAPTMASPLLLDSCVIFNQEVHSGRKTTPKAAAVAVILTLLATALLVGCGNDRENGKAPPVDTTGFVDLVADSPPELSKLYDRGNELTGSGPEEFDKTLEAVEGYPAVVNVWASWCGPCRAEFPYFREAALQHGSEVAFLGINSDDNEDAAKTFLDNHPVPYPSISDPDREIATEIGASFGFPATAFYNPEGEQVHIKHGGYDSLQELNADIERHLKDPR